MGQTQGMGNTLPSKAAAEYSDTLGVLVVLHTQNSCSVEVDYLY